MDNPRIFDLFEDSYEYPSQQIVFHGGVLPNTLYSYVSSTFLNGFINYTKVIKAYMVERYQDWDDKEEYLEVTEAIAKLNTEYHTNWGAGPDDVYVLAETDYDYWLFIYDRDCSDSNVGRISKTKVSRELIIDLFEDVTSNNSHYAKGRKLEFSTRGWIGG